jgi:hypothetical protein
MGHTRRVREHDRKEIPKCEYLTCDIPECWVINAVRRAVHSKNRSYYHIISNHKYHHILSLLNDVFGTYTCTVARLITANGSARHDVILVSTNFFTSDGRKPLTSISPNGPRGIVTSNTLLFLLLFLLLLADDVLFFDLAGLLSSSSFPYPTHTNIQMRWALVIIIMR